MQQPPPRYDFRPSQFPITIRYFRTDTNELVHTQIISSPGLLHIEPWARIVGAPVRIEVEFGDGECLRTLSQK